MAAGFSFRSLNELPWIRGSRTKPRSPKFKKPGAGYKRMCKNILIAYCSLRKTVGKVSPILVTLTSRSDSDFESSNLSLKENKPDGVIRTLTISTITFERTKAKFYGFRQTDCFYGVFQNMHTILQLDFLGVNTLKQQVFLSFRISETCANHFRPYLIFMASVRNENSLILRLHSRQT